MRCPSFILIVTHWNCKDKVNGFLSRPTPSKASKVNVLQKMLFSLLISGHLGSFGNNILASVTQEKWKDCAALIHNEGSITDWLPKITEVDRARASY